MFKLICLAVVAGAFAADTTAPVISLDFVGAFTDGSVANPHSSAVTSSAHFADECQVDQTCTLPTPKAYDHHEGELTDQISTAIQLFVALPSCVTANLPCAAFTPTASTTPTLVQSSVDNTKRGEWVLTYDVDDTSGNSADSVTFAVIMQDKVKPTSTLANIAWTYGKAADIFSAVTDGSSAGPFADNYDALVTIVRTVTTIDNCDLGTNVDTYAVCDFAGLFGESFANNCETFTRDIVVSYGTQYTNTVELQSNIIVDPRAGASHQEDFSLECQKTDFATTQVDEDGVSNFGITAEGCNCETTNSAGTSTLSHGSGLCQWKTASTYAGHTRSFDVCPTFRIPAATVVDKSDATHCKTFTVSDTTPPTVEWDGTFAQSNKVGTAAVGTPAFTDKTHKGLDYYSHLASGATGGLMTNMALLNNDIIQHSAGYTNDAEQINGAMGIRNDRFTCADTCSSDDNLTIEGSWHDAASFVCDSAVHSDGQGTSTMDLISVGTFVFKYTCTDEASHTTTMCKTVYNQDHTQPILNIITPAADACSSASGLTGSCFDAASTGFYDDDGAICSDMVDGDISELVEVSGDVVSLSVIGTYHITYKCSDTAGNDATEMVRTVYVQDQECPTCPVASDEQTVNQEASFPYSDEAVTCSDNMPFTENDMTTITVTATSNAVAVVDVEETGEYVITYTATDVNGNTNTLLKNIASGTTACNADIVQLRTVVVSDSLKPIITLDNSLMEESTGGLNAWVAGAVASAVAGVALLGYSSSKTVSTQVPV